MHGSQTIKKVVELHLIFNITLKFVNMLDLSWGSELQYRKNSLVTIILIY